LEGETFCQIDNQRFRKSAVVDRDSWTSGVGQPHVGLSAKFLVLLGRWG